MVTAIFGRWGRVGKIDVRKIKEFISETLGYFKDIPLFFKNGKEYFIKIEDENTATNLHRLTIYIITSFLIQLCLLSVKYTIAYNPYEIAGWLLFQIPIVSLGYFFALVFSDTKYKVKTCLNYVIFQNMITGLLPFMFLALFINTEVYFFYYLHALTLIAFIIFVLLKFILLFYKTWTKRILSLGIVLLTIASLVGIVVFLDIPEFKGIVAFEDPIASEFFELGCIEETDDFNVKIDDIQEIHDVINKINNNYNNGILIKDVTHIVETGIISKISYNWKFKKQKEFKLANENIDRLKKKLNKAHYDRNKGLIYQNIELNKSYIDLLKEYDETIFVLSNIDYNNLYKVEMSANIKLTGRQNITEKDVTEYKNKINEMSLVNSNLEKLNQACASTIHMTEKANSVITGKINLKKSTLSYLEFIHKVEKFLPIYLYKSSPLKEYEFM
ncbi:MAG: hypothetical protein AB9895_00145 [Negativicutes bacterium]